MARRMIRLSGMMNVGGAESGIMDLPPDNQLKSAQENAEFKARIKKLIYGPFDSPIDAPKEYIDTIHQQPPKNQSFAELLLAQGTQAAAEEAVFFAPVTNVGRTLANALGIPTPMPSEKAEAAFNELNKTWRRLEAWAGVGLGAEIGYGPFKKDTVALNYNNWLSFSHRWKAGAPNTPELSPMSISLQAVEKIASEYGYPGIYHPDRREEASKTGVGSTHWVETPGVEEQSSFLNAADRIDKSTPNVDIPNPGDVFGKIPMWVKIVAGTAAFGLIVAPVVQLIASRRPS